MRGLHAQILALLSGFALIGCSAELSRLDVELRTDLLPVTEFDSTVTELLRPVGAGGALEPLRTVERPAGDEPFYDGVLIAELTDLEVGQYAVRVRLLLGTEQVAERLVRVSLDGSIIATVVVTRSCAGVVCPGPGDDPAATTCVGGECVDPGCDGDPTCLPPECTVDADCPTTSECGRGRCAGGRCLVEADDAACALSSTCVVDTCVASFAGGEYGWSFTGGGLNGDEAQAVAVDAMGNVYVTGLFRERIDFGGGERVRVDNAAAFVASYDDTGAYRWDVVIFGPGLQRGEDIAVSAAGDVYVTGHFEGTATFPDGDYTADGQDCFVARFGQDGGLDWARAFGGAGDDVCGGVAAHPDGVVVGGGFATEITHGGEMHTSAGGFDAFVALFATDGTPSWLWKAGAAADDRVDSIAVDGTDIYASGFVTGNVDFGMGIDRGAGEMDVFVVELDTAGSLVSAITYGGPGSERGRALTVCGDAVAIAGRFEDALDLGGGDRTSNGAQDAFVLYSEMDGGRGWDRTWGGAGQDSVLDVDCDEEDNVFVTGRLESDVDFGGGSTSVGGGGDLYVASFTSDGGHRWDRTWGDVSVERGNGIVVSSGAVVVGGLFSGEIDLGAGPRTTAGSTDMLVLSLAD